MTRAYNNGPRPRRWRNERGQAFVEFAFVVPFLFALVFGLVQFGLVFKNWIALQEAVRAAARAEAVCRFPQPNLPSGKAFNAANVFTDDTTDVPGAAFGPDPGCPVSGTVVTLSGQFPWNISIPFIGPVMSGTRNSTVVERVE